MLGLGFTLFNKLNETSCEENSSILTDFYSNTPLLFLICIRELLRIKLLALPNISRAPLSMLCTTDLAGLFIPSIFKDEM